MTEYFDLVVAGGGMSGLCAAVAALEAGAKVLVLEKSERCGGSMLYSQGFIWTYADKEHLFRELPDGNRALQEMILDSIDGARDWLEDQGVVLGPEKRFMWFGRGRKGEPSSIAEIMSGRVRDLGGTIALHSAMTRLIPDGGGVSEIEFIQDGDTVRRRVGAVVLATGGFQGNVELLNRYLGPNADKMYLRSNPWSTGDGYLAASALGAASTPWLSTYYGHAMAAEPSEFSPEQFLEATQKYGHRAVALNLDGMRFADESFGTGEGHLNQVLAQQREAMGVYVVDAEIAGMSETGTGTAADSIARARDLGAPVIEADTLQGLCEAMGEWGIDPWRSLSSLEGYNRSIVDDDPWMYPPRTRTRVALSRPPFMAVLVRASITFTCGGLAVDRSMRVLRRAGIGSLLPKALAHGHPIPAPGFDNLFASGCDVGAISNSGYMGGLATALVTGLTAGRMAAETAGARKVSTT